MSRAGGGISTYQIRVGSNAYDATRTDRDREAAARHDAESAPHAPVDTWPELWGDRPEGWTQLDEIPSLDEVS